MTHLCYSLHSLLLSLPPTALRLYPHRSLKCSCGFVFSSYSISCPFSLCFCDSPCCYIFFIVPSPSPSSPQSTTSPCFQTYTLVCPSIRSYPFYVCCHDLSLLYVSWFPCSFPPVSPSSHGPQITLSSSLQQHAFALPTVLISPRLLSVCLHRSSNHNVLDPSVQKLSICFIRVTVLPSRPFIKPHTVLAKQAPLYLAVFSLSPT